MFLSLAPGVLGPETSFSLPQTIKSPRIEMQRKENEMVNHRNTHLHANSQ